MSHADSTDFTESTSLRYACHPNGKLCEVQQTPWNPWNPREILNNIFFRENLTHIHPPNGKLCEVQQNPWNPWNPREILNNIFFRENPPTP